MDKKPVTDEGVPSNLDLGNVEPPTQDAMNSLDLAMESAGLGKDFDFSKASSAQEDSKEESSTEDKPEESTEDNSESSTEDKPEDTSAEEKSEDTKEESSTGDTKESQTGDPKKKDDDYEVDLDTIKAPEDISPRNLVNFDRLRKMVKHFKEEAKKVPSLEEQIQSLQSKAIPETLEKELSELRTFKKLFDIENDPEFKKAFDEGLGEIDSEILSLLQKNGLSEETAKQIKEFGIENIEASWWEENILEKLSFIDKDRIQRKLTDRADKFEKRQEEIRKYSEKKEDYLKEEESRRAEAREGESKAIYEHVNQLTKGIAWAQYREAPKDATPEQIKEIEAHNKSVDELDRQFEEAISATDPRARAEIAAAAVASVRLAENTQILSQQLKQAEEKAAKLQKELDAIKAAGRIPDTRQTTRQPTKGLTYDPLALSNEDAIEKGLSAVES